MLYLLLAGLEDAVHYLYLGGMYAALPPIPYAFDKGSLLLQVLNVGEIGLGGVDGRKLLGSLIDAAGALDR